MSEMPHCCWPTDEAGTNCPKPALFEVWDQIPGDPYSGTHTCAEHLAEACDSNGAHHHVNHITANMTPEDAQAWREQVAA